MSEKIDVKLGTRSYLIHIAPGAIDQAGTLLKPFAPPSVAIVTDRHVAKNHLVPLVASLEHAGIDGRAIVLSPGESTKSFGGLEKLCGALLEAGVDRGGLIIALGGGVIGDLAGFAAGILKRGIDYVQIPTTLLAQVDSSVGGKTAINTAQGKNLVGLFHQPRMVIADTAVLATLPRRELLAGYAEVVKYGVLGDEKFFVWLETNGAQALRGDAEKLGHIVARSCTMKAEIVARDEREQGDRALLNLGHTFGHALEAATDYSDRLLHGEAVAIGMVLALRLSASLGYAPAADAERLARHLHAIGLPAALADIPGVRPATDTLLAHMMHDKKAASGQLTFVLSRGLGRTFTSRNVPLDAVRAVLA
jgi:3-dehydroquinate synthase